MQETGSRGHCLLGTKLPVKSASENWCTVEELKETTTLTLAALGGAGDGGEHLGSASPWRKNAVGSGGAVETFEVLWEAAGTEP